MIQLANFLSLADENSSPNWSKTTVIASWDSICVGSVRTTETSGCYDGSSPDRNFAIASPIRLQARVSVNIPEVVTLTSPAI